MHFEALIKLTLVNKEIKQIILGEKLHDKVSLKVSIDFTFVNKEIEEIAKDNKFNYVDIFNEKNIKYYTLKCITEKNSFVRISTQSKIVTDDNIKNYMYPFTYNIKSNIFCALYAFFTKISINNGMNNKY